jgi:hypothetical protein
VHHTQNILNHGYFLHYCSFYWISIRFPDLKSCLLSVWILAEELVTATAFWLASHHCPCFWDLFPSRSFSKFNYKAQFILNWVVYDVLCESLSTKFLTSKSSTLYFSSSMMTFIRSAAGMQFLRLQAVGQGHSGIQRNNSWSYLKCFVGFGALFYSFMNSFQTYWPQFNLKNEGDLHHNFLSPFLPPAVVLSGSEFLRSFWIQNPSRFIDAVENYLLLLSEFCLGIFGRDFEMQSIRNDFYCWVSFLF